MNHQLNPVPGRVGGLEEDRRVFVLLDDDIDRPDRGVLEWAVLTAVLDRSPSGSATSSRSRSPPTPERRRGGVEVLVTVANADNETSYVPALEAAGYDLVMRVLGHRVLTLPGCGVWVHVCDDDPAVDFGGPGLDGPPLS